MRYSSILGLVGNTPHVHLSKLFTESEVWIKLEKQNPGGSIKDRIALAMIEKAEKDGVLKPGMTIIEPTSGNTGVGLSMVGAYKGYRVKIVMPESMSIERRKLILAYGAELILTPKEKGMKGAIEKAKELHDADPDSWMPHQFENLANPWVHEQHTAMEIIKDFPEGFDYFVTGVGTGGHISGVGKVLKDKFPNLEVVAVEPENSPVLSGGAPGPHVIQGIGAGFVPYTLSMEIPDHIITISNEDAFARVRELAHKEGILGGISTGASIAAVKKVEKQFGVGSRILTFNYDTGERYLSVDGLF